VIHFIPWSLRSALVPAFTDRSNVARDVSVEDAIADWLREYSPRTEPKLLALVLARNLGDYGGTRERDGTIPAGVTRPPTEWFARQPMYQALWRHLLGKDVRPR
jgi:hypothetical protein